LAKNHFLKNRWLKDFHLKEKGCLTLFTMKQTIFFLLAITINHLYAQEKWSIAYPDDNFSEDALLDLRYLNEDEAGDNGFIQQSVDGEG